MLQTGDTIMQYQMAGEEWQLIRGRLTSSAASPCKRRHKCCKHVSQLCNTLLRWRGCPLPPPRRSPGPPGPPQPRPMPPTGGREWGGVGGQNVWGWGHTVGCLSTWGGRAAPTHHSSPAICRTTSRRWVNPIICSRVSAVQTNEVGACMT